MIESNHMGPNQKEVGKESEGGCVRFSILVFVAWGLFGFLLLGFVSTKSLIFLSLTGAILLIAGIYLTIHFAHHIVTLVGLVAFALGLILILGAIATLLPAAPDNLLVKTSIGWNILENRTLRLGKAIDNDNIGLARKLARRGLGDPQPLGSFGRPLIHDCKSSNMVTALFNGTNLNPDAQDLDGYTLLMNTYDPKIATAILDAGADPNVRSKDGRTPLMFSAGKPLQLIRILLEKGADVHAVDEDGDSVATYFGIDDVSLTLLEKYSRGTPLIKASNPHVGREEWLVINRDPSAKIEPSSIKTDPSPLRYGDLATVEVRIGNDSDTDRRIQVKTKLNQVLLFVDASHAGEIENKKEPQMDQTIRWPVLSLPAHSQGILAVRVVARSDERQAGDAMIDVEIRQMDGSVEQLNFHQAAQRREVSFAANRASYMIPVLFGIVMIVLFIWIRIRKPGTQTKAQIATSILAVFCLGVAFLLVVSFIDPFVRFEEATCTILDRRYRLESVRTSSRSRRAASTNAVPITAVRINSNGQRLISTGFSLGSTHSVDVLRQFPLGSKVRCWVFPGDRSIFTLTRYPGTGWIIVLGILILIGSACMTFVFTAKSQKSHTSKSN